MQELVFPASVCLEGQINIGVVSVVVDVCWGWRRKGEDEAVRDSDSAPVGIGSGGEEDEQVGRGCY